jgi:Zn-dependent protease with chaperone function
MLAAWLAWAGVGAVRFVRAMIALRRARANSRPFPQPIESALEHWRQIRDRGRRPRLVVSDAVTAAAVLGCGRPVIAVAPALVTTLEAGELDRVVVHEWAHVQRRDDLVNLLQIAVRVVAGWHPAVWWIDRRLQAEREIACDEATVALTGAPKSYAACLVKLAGLRAEARAALAAPAVLTASGLRARVSRIVAREAFLAPRRAVAFAAAGAAVLATVSVLVAQTRLVEKAAFVVPYDSIRLAAARVEGFAPIGVPVGLPSQDVEPAPGRRAVASPAAQSVDQAVAAPAIAAPREAQREPSPPSVGAAADSADTPVPAEPHAERVADREPVTTLPLPPPVQAAAAPVDPNRSPWAGAATGGKVIGRVSKDAGVATAGAFSRFARRVADSF